MAVPLSGLSGLACEYVVPDPSSPPQETISRWSDARIEHPALKVIPNNENDIRTAVKIAKENGLSVMASGGGHGTFLAVDAKCLYLDLKNLDSIELDKSQGTVRFGGGLTTGQILKSLAAEDYYTPLPASNAVGVVGCILGGGSTSLNGLHGFMADIVRSFRLITGGGEVVEVSSASTGKDKDLFNALCGAGHGLGIITAVTTAAYPISALRLTEDKLWQRSLVFPPPHINVAAQAFLDLEPALPASSVSLTFVRSPPGTPAPGAPIIVLGVTHWGPAEEAETMAALLYKPDLVEKAIVARTEQVPVANINDRFEGSDVRGGYKAIRSARLQKLNVGALKSSFQHWLDLTTNFPDAKRSLLTISTSHRGRCIAHGHESSKFIEARDRAFTAMAIQWCDRPETQEAWAKFAETTMAELRSLDEGVVPRTVPNNMRFGMELEELFERERFEELARIKGLWDGDDVFWSPYRYLA